MRRGFALTTRLFGISLSTTFTQTRTEFLVSIFLPHELPHWVLLSVHRLSAKCSANWATEINWPFLNDTDTLTSISSPSSRGFWTLDLKWIVLPSFWTDLRLCMLLGKWSVVEWNSGSSRARASLVMQQPALLMDDHIGPTVLIPNSYMKTLKT